MGAQGCVAPARRTPDTLQCGTSLRPLRPGPAPAGFRPQQPTAHVPAPQQPKHQSPTHLHRISFSTSSAALPLVLTLSRTLPGRRIFSALTTTSSMVRTRIWPATKSGLGSCTWPGTRSAGGLSWVRLARHSHEPEWWRQDLHLLGLLNTPTECRGWHLVTRSSSGWRTCWL